MSLRRSLLVASGAVLLAVASAQVGHTPAPGESDEASDVSFSSDAGDLVLPPCMNGCDATLIDAMRAANNHDAMCAALAPVYDSMCMDDCKGAGPVEHVIDEYLEECCAYPPWGPRGVLGGGRGERVSSPGGGAERSGRVRNVGLGTESGVRAPEVGGGDAEARSSLGDTVCDGLAERLAGAAAKRDVRSSSVAAEGVRASPRASEQCKNRLGASQCTLPH